MINESASRGSQIEYTELSQLQPAKSVSVFGYVHKIVYVFNKDLRGQPQHEYLISLMDSKTLRPVTFSLFRNNDDEAFRGQLREGILVRVHRARCRKTDGEMWLFGRAGVAGMHVVGFELRDVLNLLCTTSSSFSFTQLHHSKLNELQRHFMRRGNVADSTSGVFAFRSRPIGRLVPDHTYAPSVTYAIETLKEPLPTGHSPPPLVIKLEDDEPESKENAAAVVLKSARRPPVLIKLDDDEQEAEKSAAAVGIKSARRPPVPIKQEDDEWEAETSAAAVGIKPTWMELNAAEGQVTEGVAARRSNTSFSKSFSYTQNPLSAAYSPTKPTAPKRPCMELALNAADCQGVAASRSNNLFSKSFSHTQFPLAAAFSDTKPTAPKRPYMEPALNAVEDQSSGFVAAGRSNTPFSKSFSHTQVPPAAASFPAQPTAPQRPRMEPSSAAQSRPFLRHRQTLRSAQRCGYFDSICEVIGVLDNGDHVILRVWDGTKPSRNLARYQNAKPITLDAELEASVKDYVVDIVCWEEHADSARGLEPHDKVSIVNVHAFVNKAGVEAYTMHGGLAYGRDIRLLENRQQVEELESRLSALSYRPSAQSQDVSDDESFFA